jgi:hypothetical protein
LVSKELEVNEVGIQRNALAGLPPIVTVVPLTKPLQRIVRVAPPAAEPVEGDKVPMPGGTLADRAMASGVLRGAIGRGGGEEALAVFIRSEEAPVESVNVGHQVLRQDNRKVEKYFDGERRGGKIEGRRGLKSSPPGGKLK